VGPPTRYKGLKKQRFFRPFSLHPLQEKRKTLIPIPNCRILKEANLPKIASLNVPVAKPLKHVFV
jgi:hypothetical protein